MQRLVHELKTTSSTIYNNIRDASITILDSQLHSKNELSAHASFERRSRKAKLSNHLKRDKLAPLIALVVSQLKTNTLASVDEVIHDLKINRTMKIETMDYNEF
ncbi:MAG: hypothetical protein ACK5KR_06255 [Breznakia sp.]